MPSCICWSMKSKARWRASSDAQFLGYSFWVAKGAVVKRSVTDKPMATFKQRIRQLTRRSGGRSVQDVVQRLRPYVLGWKAYFG